MLIKFSGRLLNKLQTKPNPIATNEEGLLANLPQEITIDILSRLPIDTVMRCKCVCKPWRDLMESSEFATSHRSKSTAAASCLFMIQDMESTKPYKISAFDGGSSNSRVVSHHLGFPRNNHRYMRLIPHSSANGLLLLVDQTFMSHCLLICNPISREYMELPPPPPHHGRNYTLGFGASRVSGRYKVAMIFTDHRPKCEVYSVGTGLWRSVAMAADSHYKYKHSGVGVFLNGNLHWLAYDLQAYFHTMISCFDLDTELFTSFAAPPPHRWGWLSALEGRLCLCNHSDGDEIVIWLMNKYGDGDSWVKEFIINAPPPLYRESFEFRFILPIKVFKDGGHILFAVEDCDQLFLYSNRTKTIQKYDRLRLCRHYSTNVVVYTPTFLSLQTMGVRYCRALMFNRF